jgi:hypothetical protein
MVELRKEGLSVTSENFTNNVVAFVSFQRTTNDYTR